MVSSLLKKSLVLICVLSNLCSCSTGGIPPTQKHDYPETPYVDYNLTGLPEFVEGISECIDTEKQYVLPDGYLYEYKAIPTYSAVNQLEIATDIDGSVFNGCGYQDNARIRGVLEVGESDISFITGFIPIESGDSIHFSNNCFNPQNTSAHILHTAFYDDAKQIIGSTSMSAAEEKYFEIVEQNNDGYATTIKVEDTTNSLAFIRLTLIGSGESQIISINEPLIATYDDYSWIKTDKYVSSDWIDEIDSVSEHINNIEILDESKVTKFFFASDMHLDPGSTSSYTEDIGKVCAEVMKRCNISFYIDAGDSSTQSSGFMPSDFEKNISDVLSQLSPIPHKNILLAVGNHDGATGKCMYNEELVYYRYQLTNEQRSAVFFDWQRDTNEYKRFDSDGTYYYIDDLTTKTRYIILNPFWSKWAGDEEGFVVNIQHSFFHTPLYGEQQLKWFAEEALDMPSDYAAVIIAHHVNNVEANKNPVIDYAILKGIVDAFNNKSKYSGTCYGAEEWQSTNISVNYENANGEIIAIFSGHNHKNITYDYFETVPCIHITTTGAYWDVRDENAEERIRGTASEFSVDAVVIDRVSRKIYMNRLGAGEDRIIEY